MLLHGSAILQGAIERVDAGADLGVQHLRIVRKHGGWIRVRSLSEGPKTGTAFAMFFPLKEEAKEGQAPPEGR